MAKLLVFGNGRLHIGLDEHGLVHDVYYPFIGLNSQMAPHGFAHKVGIFEDGRISWLDDDGWKLTASYHKKAMIGHTVATNESLGLRVEFTDAVDSEYDAFLRSIHVINLRDVERNLSLYYHQGFMLADSASSCTAQYRSDLPGIMHYKGATVCIVGLYEKSLSFDDFSIGKYDFSTGSSTFRDAEDGSLSKNTVENGQVDSVMGHVFRLRPFDSTRFEYTLAFGESVDECEETFLAVQADGVLHHIAKTAAYWQAWSTKAAVPASLLSAEQFKALESSLFVIKAHIDERGAIMASLDSSLRNHPQDDTYNFCWPRDASYALWPLIRLGYTDEARRFFEFARKGLQPDGYLSHKYRADGTLGSTWLPYEHPDGSVHPPIQADETALTLFLIGQYHRHTNDQSILTKHYEDMVEPMANFLADYTYLDGLPRPSYDLWEHSYLTHTYTTAITYASLLEAAELAEIYGRTVDASRWRQAAEKMRKASQCLYNPETKYFYKGFFENKQGERSFEGLIDISSLYGAFMYGLFDLETPELAAAIVTAKERLSAEGLYCRFEGDDYFCDPKNMNIWLFVSLWMAEIALEQDETEEGEAIISKVLALGSPSGMLPEQVTRGKHESVSLNPLVWTHAELISALIDYAQAKRVGSRS